MLRRVTLGSLLASNGGSPILPAFRGSRVHGNQHYPVHTALVSSMYHGLDVQVNRRFTNGLQFQAAYTFSHNIDNSTADFFSTVITPRRGQDFQNLAADRSASALDHRNRFTFAGIYDMAWYRACQLVHEELGWKLAIRPHLYLRNRRMG